MNWNRYGQRAVLNKWSLYFNLICHHSTLGRCFLARPLSRSENWCLDPENRIPIPIKKFIVGPWIPCQRDRSISWPSNLRLLSFWQRQSGSIPMLPLADLLWMRWSHLGETPWTRASCRQDLLQLWCPHQALIFSSATLACRSTSACQGLVLGTCMCVVSWRRGFLAKGGRRYKHRVLIFPEPP